jgi:hypothetical protein
MPTAGPNGVEGAGQQSSGFLDRGCGIGLVAEPFREFLLGRGILGKWVDEAARRHRGDILDDFGQDRPVEGEVHGAAHPRIVERFLRRHHEADRAGLRQLEFNRVFVALLAGYVETCRQMDRVGRLVGHALFLHRWRAGVKKTDNGDSGKCMS